MATTCEFQHFIVDDVVLVRWRRPTVSASARLGRLIDEAHAAAGHKLVMVVIIGPDCPPPDAETRRELLNDFASVDHCLMMIRLTLLGKGLKATVMRSICAGLMLATRRGRNFALDKSIEMTLEHTALATDCPPQRIIDALLAEDMLDPTELEITTIGATGS